MNKRQIGSVYELKASDYLTKKGYREAVVPQMNYIIIFDVRADDVNVVGIFHQLENYPNKL